MDSCLASQTPDVSPTHADGHGHGLPVTAALSLSLTRQKSPSARAGGKPASPLPKAHALSPRMHTLTPL